LWDPIPQPWLWVMTRISLWTKWSISLTQMITKQSLSRPSQSKMKPRRSRAWNSHQMEPTFSWELGKIPLCCWMLLRGPWYRGLRDRLIWRRLISKCSTWSTSNAVSPQTPNTWSPAPPTLAKTYSSGILKLARRCSSCNFTQLRSSVSSFHMSSACWWQPAKM
jgi:hypothetical protein